LTCPTPFPAKAPQIADHAQRKNEFFPGIFTSIFFIDIRESCQGENNLLGRCDVFKFCEDLHFFEKPGGFFTGKPEKNPERTAQPMSSLRVAVTFS
jgi:hypothetical protein